MKPKSKISVASSIQVTSVVRGGDDEDEPLLSVATDAHGAAERAAAPAVKDGRTRLANLELPGP